MNQTLSTTFHFDKKMFSKYFDTLILYNFLFFKIIFTCGAGSFRAQAGDNKQQVAQNCYYNCHNVQGDPTPFVCVVNGVAAGH